MVNITVLGSGGWGTAIAILLSNNGHQVTLWSYFEHETMELSQTKENKALLPGVLIPEQVRYTSNIKQAVENANIIVIATPSFAVRQTVNSFKPYYQKSQLIVNISKGLEEDSLLTLSKVIRSEIPDSSLCVMSGPSHAEEVARGIPTTNVVASDVLENAFIVQDTFMNKLFRVYTSDDILGVETGGSLKNVIALSAGICDGLGYGDNTKAALMTRGMAEITRLGVKMGGKKETFWGLSGIGDLIVTCTSMHSRNRRAGILIGQGLSVSDALKEVNMVVEGYKTSKAAYHLAKMHKLEMPIINQAYEVLYNHKNPKQAVSDLMMRDKKHEMEKEYLSGEIFDDF